MRRIIAFIALAFAGFTLTACSTPSTPPVQSHVEPSAPFALTGPDSHVVYTKEGVPTDSKTHDIIFDTNTYQLMGTEANQRIIAQRVKKYHSPEAFEIDMRLCELAYPEDSEANRNRLSFCINDTIAKHHQYN